MSLLWVTGFEPFGNMASNPSAELVARIDERGDARLATAVLPVDGRRIRGVLQGIWRQKPAAVIHLGLAEERKSYSSELRACNVLRYPRPDNAGAVEQGAVEEGGPCEIATRLNHQALLQAWNAHGLPGELSQSAGHFLCNQSLYLSLRALPDVPVGFIHLPPTPQLTEAPGRPLEEQLRAVDLVIEQVLGSIASEASVC